MEALLGKNLNQLQDLAQELGLPKFVGKQLAQWLYQKRATRFEEMTNLSLKVRDELQKRYIIGRHAPIREALSADGTKKYLFETTNEKGQKNFIETVYIPDKDRATLCISTQMGCRMGCKFCMTGTLGFHGHLSAAEILNQIFSVPDSDTLTNLVYMGEGEPCDNIDAVLTSLDAMTANWGCAWSPHRITVSSVGLLPGLARLLDTTDCHLAISLHNPFEEERAALMPAQKLYSLDQVLTLLRQYDFTHQRRLSFEYILFDGKNDSIRYANQLRRLLQGLNCRINLIRFHEDPETSAQLNNGLHPTPLPKAEEFRDYLSQNGIITTIRRSRGEDILAACGMLVNSLQKESQ